MAETESQTRETEVASSSLLFCCSSTFFLLFSFLVGLVLPLLPLGQRLPFYLYRTEDKKGAMCCMFQRDAIFAVFAVFAGCCLCFA